MIGIAFLTVIGLWIAFAVFSGRKVAAWLDRQDPPRAWLRYAWMTFFVFLPVMDEVIAYPQVMLICQKAKDSFWYDKTAVQKAVIGANVLGKEDKKIFPGITLKITEWGVLNAENGNIVIKSKNVRVGNGFLHFPNGSGAGSMPLILPESCPSGAWEEKRFNEAKKTLRLKYLN